MCVVDKDFFSWMGCYDCLAEDIVHGKDQALEVTFFDKTKDETVRIDSDSACYMHLMCIGTVEGCH